MITSVLFQLIRNDLLHDLYLINFETSRVQKASPCWANKRRRPVASTSFFQLLSGFYGILWTHWKHSLLCNKYFNKSFTYSNSARRNDLFNSISLLRMSILIFQEIVWYLKRFLKILLGVHQIDLLNMIKNICLVN